MLDFYLTPILTIVNSPYRESVEVTKPFAITSLSNLTYCLTEVNSNLSCGTITEDEVVICRIKVID